MNSFYQSLLSVLVVTTACVTISAQNTVLELKQPVQRIPFDLQPGKNQVVLNGLEPGKTYALVPVLYAYGQEGEVSLRFRDAGTDRLAVSISPENKPHMRRWTATADHADLEIRLAGTKRSQPAFLSVMCEDCERDNTWWERFQDQVENMAVLTVVPGVGAVSLVENTLVGGDCFDVTNITAMGNANSRGTFGSGSSSISMETGVVLCSGHVNILPGPNDQQNANNGFNTNSPDDPDLATLTNGNQWDVTKIEFDFTPTENKVQFEFVFGSEEYCEYVGSQFNDVFGFFISGPGIAGVKNLAVIPGTSTPITINNVNHQNNSSYYVNNNTWNPCQNLSAYAPNDIELDGYTTVLLAETQLIPCETYHIKLAIADVADAAFASAVFLKANSFDAGGQVDAAAFYPGGQNFVYEDCNGNGYIRFYREGGDPSQPLVINYTIGAGSTATPGDDYAPLSGTITIPANQNFIDLPITVYADLIIEGNETIIFEIENACTCDATEIEFVIADVPPLDIDLDDQVLCGGNSVTLSPSVDGGLAPLTYQWSNGATTPSITVNTPGTTTHGVTVTDFCGTKDSVEVTVTIEPVPTANLTGAGVLCGGVQDTVELTLVMTGTAPWIVTYTANGATVTETFTTSPVTIYATDPGSYSLVSIASQGGCDGTVSGNINITEITVDANIASTNPPCFGLNTGSISVTPSGGNTPYQYSWSNNGNGPSQNNLPPGNYAVTVTDNNGCSATASADIVAPPQLTANVNVTNNIDCYTPTGNADLTVDGGTPGYNYQWSNGSNIEDPQFTVGGTFTVTVTDNNNCTTTATVTITANLTPPVAAATFSGVINCNTTEITINGNGSSQGPNFSYEWSGPSFVCCETTLNPIVNEGGTYTLTVTNADNGCTATASVTIPQDNDPPVANINAPAEIGCDMPVISLNGAGTSQGPGINYTWSTNDGNFVCCTNTLNPQVNQAGTYTLSVVNTVNGCTAETSVTVSGDTIKPLAVVLPPNEVNCYEPEITIDASGSSQGGNLTYVWTTTNGNITGGQGTLTPSVDQGGTYTLVITNGDNNCTATVSVTVGEDTAIPAAVASGNGIINCNTPTLTLNGVGSATGPTITYQWTTDVGNIVSGENTLNPVIDAAGTYTLLVTNTDNGCTNEASVTINDDLEFPLADAGPDLLLSCYDPTITIQGQASTGPGFTLQWLVNPGNIVSGANTPTPVVNQPGIYTLVVTNTTNGCISLDEIEVTENFDQPDAQIAPAGILDCYNETIDLDAGASAGNNLFFQWTTSNGNIVTGQNSPYPTVDEPGTYNLVVTDLASGCTDQAQVTVQQNITPPVVNAGPDLELDCTNPIATLNGNGSSQGNNFSYEWFTADGNILSGAFGLTPQVDAPGTYTLLITNLVNGCTAEDNAVVTADQDQPNADAGPDMAIDCSNASVQLDGTWSTGQGMQIQWTANPGNIVSGGNTLTPTVNQPGYYSLLITNPSNGCTATDEVFVDDQVIYPEALVAPPGQLDCTYESVIIDAGNSTQGPDIVFSWTTSNGNILYGEDTPFPEVDEPGNYFLTITNTANNCTTTASVSVAIDTISPTAVAQAPDTLTCEFPIVEINGAGSSGGYPFFYEWTTSNGNIVSGHLTLNPLVDLPGAYTLTVYNIENGCTSAASTTVNSSQVFPDADAGPAQTITCTNGQLTLDGNNSSQGPQYTYVWTTSNGNILGGANSLTPLINAPGVYDLSVVNINTGCAATSSVAVGINTVLPQASVAPGGILSCTLTSLVLDGSGSSGGGGFTYLWTTQNGNILSGDTTLQPVVNAVGDYTLLVTNTTNGCTATASTNVQADASLPVADAGPADTLNCYAAQLVLNGVNSSQGAEYTYQWTGNGIVSGANSLTPVINAAGNYQLLVTNTTNGCTATDAVAVIPDLVPPVALAGADAVLNCYQPQLTLNGNGSSAGPVFTYNWTTVGGNILSGADSLAPLVDASGNYILQVNNTRNGCSSLDSVLINADFGLPQADAGGPGLIDCSNPTVTLQGTGSAGAEFVYLWTTNDGNIASGDSTLNPVVDAPGSYVLYILDASNGCSTTDTVAVDRDAAVPNATAQVPGELNCINSSLQLNGAGSSQDPGIIFYWQTTNGNIISGDSTLTPVVDLPGQYTLNVFNTNNNCLATYTVDVVLNTTPPVASAGAPQVLSCLNPVLTLNGSNSSQGPQFTYQWTTQNGNIVSGATTLSPQVDKSGFYRIIVTNQQNGCTATANVQILLDQNTPVANAGQTNVLTCDVQSLNLSGAGSSVGPNFSYAWSTSNGNIVSGANGMSPVVDQPGTYLLLVSNALNGCTATSTVVISQDTLSPLAAIAAPDILNCQVTTLDLDASAGSTGPGFAYLWTTNDGNILSGATGIQPTVNQPGQYALLVTNTQTGCTSTTAVSVDQDIAYPLADAGPGDELTCSHVSAQLQGAAANTGPAFTTVWSTSNGNLVSGANTLTPVVDAPGLYTLIVQNQINFCADTAAVLITENVVLPNVAIAAAPTITCASPTVQLNAGNSSTGPEFEYQWTTGDGNLVGGETTLFPQVDQPGSYQLVITNTITNCIDSLQVAVPIDVVPPVAEAGSADTLTCDMIALLLDGAGSSFGSKFKYAWSTSGGLITSGAFSLTPTVNLPGWYRILVTNTENGCTSLDSVLVSQDIVAPLVAAAVPGELTCTQTNLVLDGTGSSAGPVFQYEWTGPGLVSGGNSLFAQVDLPGDYTLWIRNANNGCTSSVVASVTQNINPPMVDAGADGLLNCYAATLNLSGNASGGVAGVQYTWSTADGNILSGANTPAPVIDAGGTYTLVATDVYNGCTASDWVAVQTDLVAPAVAIALPDILNCTVEIVQLDATGTSQGAAFVYEWTGPGLLSGQNALNPQVNQPGNYQLLVTNASNGCTQTSNVEVIQDVVLPAAEAGQGFELTCSVTEDQLNGAGSSTGPVYLYAWSTQDGRILSGINSLNPLVDLQGTYTLLVTNSSNGCTAADAVVVTLNTNVPVGLEMDNDPPACGGQTGVIRFAAVEGGVGPYLYSIDGGESFLSLEDFGQITPGAYSLVVQDVNGCEYAETVSFPVPVEPQIDILPEIELAFGESELLQATLNIPLHQVDTIIWSPVDGITPTAKPNEVRVTPFQTTRYEVIVVNVDGCEDRAAIIVKVDDPAIWAPNVISSNNQDGFNDHFTLFARDNTVNQINSLQIYDRWGNQVFLKEGFEPNVPTLGWDGTFRGQPMNPAVFVWWAEVELTSGQKILLKGDVTIAK